MEDLVVFLSGAAHSPLVQAALVHAQFETIHPFVDGNGRVGRALIHTVLTRRGLTPAAVLPISMVLLTQSGAYIDGLNAFRYSGPPEGPDASESFLKWFDVFCTAAEIAVIQAEKFVADLTELHAEWHERHVEYRLSAGLTGEARTTSAVSRLLLILSEAPVLTAQTVQRLLGVSQPAARAALEELASAGILYRKQVDRGATGYLAREVFDLLTL
jgi:Fic family protein